MTARTRTNGNSILVKTASNRVMVDTFTGEMTPIVEVKGRYCFPRGFAFMGIDYVSKLRQIKLPADGYRLALLLIEESGYAGVCMKPYQELAETLEVHPSRISRLLAMLENTGVAQRVGNQKSGTVMVNPSFCFQGSANEQHKAIEKWSSLHPIGIVFERKTA